MNISFVPINKSELSNKAFDNSKLYNCYSFLKAACESRYYALNTVDITPIRDADVIILLALDLDVILEIIKYKKQLRTVYIPFEPPVVNPWHRASFLKRLSGLFAHVITWQDDLIGQQNFLKFYIPYYEIRETIPTVAFDQKKLITMVIGYKTSSYADELYSQRQAMIDFFEKTCPQQFDFYGIDWPKLYHTYKGTIKDKLTVIAQYRFALCFENQRDINGYVTEKILDCFNAKVVPIYWGAANIADYVPKQCYINYTDFPSKQALYQFLVTMTEPQYQTYLIHAQAFLTSDAYKVFLPETFAKQIIDIITRLPVAKQPTKWLSLIVVVLIILQQLKHKVVLQFDKLQLYWHRVRRGTKK